jgi:hypothetical protein
MKKLIILGLGDNCILRNSIEESLKNNYQVEFIDNISELPREDNTKLLSKEDTSQLLEGTDISALNPLEDIFIIENIHPRLNPSIVIRNTNKQNSQQGWKSDNKYKRRNHR